MQRQPPLPSERSFWARFFEKLPEQPTVTTPAHRHTPEFLEAERARLASQPGLGLAGLLMVVPIAVLLAVGLGDAEDSVVVFSPLVTFALPALAMIAFWWEDWPGSSLRPGWSGLIDALLVAAAGVVLAVIGQIVVGRFDVQGIFDPDPGPGHSSLFPAALPLGLTAFTSMLQITLVWEGWPLKRLPRLLAGLVALTISWGIALLVHYMVYDLPAEPGSGLTLQEGPFSGEDISVFLAVCGSWQVWIFLVWRGWPLHGLPSRWIRIVLGNVLVIAGTALVYLLLSEAAGMGRSTILVGAAGFSSAGLVIGMLFEGAFRSRLSRSQERVVTLAATAVLGIVLPFSLFSYARNLTWSEAAAESWVGHVCVNALGLAVILHVAVFHRWPLDDRTTARDKSAKS
ncbi:hypothetical protein [Streptomyces sp. WAC 04229]|uniref:hypothetical protein n=1 Tax=Streptomyces sp. WAC 04229 TaxID=2203206 RepID=UPI003D72BD94